MNDDGDLGRIESILARYGSSSASSETRRAAAARVSAALERQIAQSQVGNGIAAAALEWPLPVAFIASAIVNAAAAVLVPSWYALAIRAALGAFGR